MALKKCRTYLVLVTTLCDEFISYFDSRFQQVFVQVVTVNTQQFCDTSTFLQVKNQILDTIKYKHLFYSYYFCAVGFSLFLTTTLFEFHATHMHNSGGNLVDIVLFFFGKSEYIESLLLFLGKLR